MTNQRKKFTYKIETQCAMFFQSIENSKKKKNKKESPKNLVNEGTKKERGIGALNRRIEGGTESIVRGLRSRGWVALRPLKP